MNSLSANSPPLRAGVLAAGRGERLRSQTNQLKPLVQVDGQTLIERVLSSMAEAGAAEVVVIINEDSLAVRDHVTARGNWPFALRWIVETTPTSMHSFLRLVETLAADGDEGPFLLSTVDTVAGALTYAQFITKACLKQADMTLALAPVGNDEKPLLVRTAPGESRIVALGAAAAPSDYATAGVYAVRASILVEGEAARRDGIDALRTFLGRLLERGYHLAGIPIAQSIDVDRPGDIRIAEEFLRSPAV
jgi:NDP-sugar pyrophosphorylase family protein